LVAAVGWGWNGKVSGWLICATCAEFVRRLPICGSPTRFGRTCRAAVRVDV
jgi:hypothetical protein